MLVIKEAVRCTMGPERFLGLFWSIVLWAFIFLPMLTMLTVAGTTLPSFAAGLVLQVFWMIWLPKHKTLEPQKVQRRSSDRLFLKSN